MRSSGHGVSDLSTGVNTLKMLMELLKSHDTPDAGHMQVIPCLTDDLASCIDTVTAVVRQAGGVVANTTAFRASAELGADTENYCNPVRGNPPAGGLTKVSEALRVTKVSGRYRATIETSSGRLNTRCRSLT